MAPSPRRRQCCCVTGGGREQQRLGRNKQTRSREDTFACRTSSWWWPGAASAGLLELAAAALWGARWLGGTPLAASGGVPPCPVESLTLPGRPATTSALQLLPRSATPLQPPAAPLLSCWGNHQRPLLGRLRRTTLLGYSVWWSSSHHHNHAY